MIMILQVRLHDHCVYAMPGWRYDKSYQVVEYTFSNLDLTTLANISNGDTRSVNFSVSAASLTCILQRP